MSEEQAQAFEIACTDQNSLQELLDGITQYPESGPDTVDMRTWGITEPEWFKAIKEAAARQIRWWISDWHELTPTGDESTMTPSQAVATQANEAVEDVEITPEGNVHDGRKWLDADGLIELYQWCRDTYGV